jgi:hypothetical protein
MKKPRLFGLEISAQPSAFLSFAALAAGLGLLAWRALKWRPATAVAGGLLAATAHTFSELWHQLGHARAAEMTGYPMQGVTFWGPLATSHYPTDEGILTPETHIQRALGGPLFSALLTAALGLLSLAAKPLGGLPLFLTVFAFLDNLLVFSLGAFLPLGFTDGSTLLTWWPQRRHGRLHISQR